MEAVDVTEPHYRIATNGRQATVLHPGGQSVPSYSASSPGPRPALRVTVRRSDGRPVGAASVTLLDSEGRQLSRIESDGNGIAEFLSTTGGELLLVVRHDGHLPQARTVLLQQQPAPTAEVEVVVPGAARLSGTVTNTARRPIEGALITLTGADGVVAASARTDAEGNYELVDLTVEQGTLAVFAPSTCPTAIPVTIEPLGKSRQDVELRGTGVISGLAQTPEGWLIGDARVSLHADGVEVASTRTDPDGRYNFTGVDPGTYTVVAVGYPPAQTQVAAGNGEAIVEPITLAHKD